MPAALRFRLAASGAFTRIRSGMDSDGKLGLSIDEDGCCLSMIDMSQRSVAERATCRRRNPVSKTAVGLNERQNALICLRECDAEQFGSKHAHAYTQHLTRAKMLVLGFGSGEEFAKIRHRVFPSPLRLTRRRG